MAKKSTLQERQEMGPVVVLEKGPPVEPDEDELTEEDFVSREEYLKYINGE